MSIEVILMVPAIAFTALLCVGTAAATALVVRDTRRQRGKWGIPLKPACCIRCGTAAPRVRRPASWRQAMWRGWTCAGCGFEVDRWGHPIEQQKTVYKWAVLHAVEKAEQAGRRAPRRDERIREVNNQTQRGDAP